MAIKSGTCSPRSSAASRRKECLALLVATFILACTGVGAQCGLSKFRTAPNSTLRICVTHGALDVTLQAGVQLVDNTLLTSEEASAKLKGVTMDMMSVVYGQILKWPYTVRYYDTVTTGFSQVAYKVRMGMDCDIGMQSFFVSAGRDLCLPTCPVPAAGTVFNNDGDYEKYLCCLDFSYPYYNGGWTFLSQVSTGANIDYISVFFQRDIVQAMCVCVICLFFMAHIIWAIERTQYGKSLLLTNPKEGFSRYYLDGLKDGVWFSSTVLMNGVVNAEKTIITPFGRLLATVWVLFGILMSAFVTAVIAASLTTSQLTTSALLTATDVAGKRLCTSIGFFESFFDSSFPGIGVQKVIKSFASDCFPLVATGEVDAVFGIREEALGYFADGNGAGLVLAPIVKSQAYGMIWPQAWPYADWVNEALLMWQQNVIATQPPYVDSIQRWYYGDAHTITYGGNVQSANQEWNWGLIGTAIALVLVYMALQGFVMIAHLRMKQEGRGDGPGEQSAGASSSKKGATSGSHKSFFMRAASAIAAPPDALTVDPEEMPAPGDMSFRRGGGASQHGSTRGLKSSPSAKLPMQPAASLNLISFSQTGTHGPSRTATLPGGSGAESAALADILKKLDVLMEAHHVGLAGAQAPVAMVITPSASGKAEKDAAGQEAAVPPVSGGVEETTEVKKFSDGAWA